jgi:hypothetical protein
MPARPFHDTGMLARQIRVVALAPGVTARRAQICEEFTPNFNRPPALLRALPHGIEKHMTIQDYSDDDIRQLLQRVMADQHSVPAPTQMPKPETKATGVSRELTFEEILKKIQDGI